MKLLQKLYAAPIIAAMVIGLAACADDDDDDGPSTTDPAQAELLHVYPTSYFSSGNSNFVRGMREDIPSTAAAIYHFDRDMRGWEPFDHIRYSWILTHEESGAGYDQEMPFDHQVEFRNGGRTVVLTPEQPMEHGTGYFIMMPIKRFAEESEDPSYKDKFFERYYESHLDDILPQWEGTPEEVSLIQDLFLNRDPVPYQPFYKHDPSNKDLPMAPFSSITMEFTQPVDAATVSYGDGPDDNIKLVQRESREFIDVDPDIVVSGRYLTIDPSQDLPPGAEISIDILEEGDPNAIQSTTGYPLQASATGGLTFGVIDDNYDTLDWPEQLTLEPVPGKSYFTGRAMNTAVDSNGELLEFTDTDFEVEMRSLPEATFTPDRSFFTIRKSDRGPGERRLALLTDANGFTTFNSRDRLAEDWMVDDTRLYADIGIIDEDGNIEASGRALFQGRASGDPGSGNYEIDLFAMVDPAALGQERLPGNGEIHLRLRMK